MQTLLIVEDEKMIRQGIATMAVRSKVPIDRIIQCKNGREAMEIVEQNRVDAVLTDIKMPKMDGIELVKRLSRIESPPQIAIISGFDDFNYAVEMLKHGALDYMLKPVKRDKVEEVLAKIEEKLLLQQQQANHNKSLMEHYFKKLVLGFPVSAKEQEMLTRNLERGMGVKDYYLVLMNSFPPALAQASQYFLVNGIEGQQLLLCPAGMLEGALDELPDRSGAGISRISKTDAYAKLAYEEARSARKTAFIKGKRHLMFQVDEMPAGSIPEHFCEKFVRQLATDKFERVLHELHNLYFRAKHNEIAPAAMLACIDDINEKLKAAYPQEGGQMLKPLTFPVFDDYIKAESQWLMQLRSRLKEQFDLDKNQEKIHTAIQYIKAHYADDLNMASVSNRVSMNYSLFSVAFKEYAGVNFVNYLKKIRISEARRLLEETEDKIIDISRRVGYDNEKHFMKTFKLICGVSPSEYRKTFRCIKK